MRKFRKPENGVAPLVRVHALWESEHIAYPTTIRIPMMDSHVVTYKIDIDMPDPHFINAMAALDALGELAVGYPPTKKRRHRKV